MANNSFDVHENVKKYHGSHLGSSIDLQTSAASCSLTFSQAPKSVVDALTLVHPEVTQRFFGCGLPVPEKLEGCKVLDLGSGSGRDCFVLSKLVGQRGHVTGIDMNEELMLVTLSFQIEASRKYIDYHRKIFGYAESNTSFVHGYMEHLSEAGIQNASMDIVVSNCVICLCPDKRAVLQEVYRVLKEGGEFYFSDMYASQVLPDSFKQDPVLWGEGMGGSLYWRDFVSLAQEVGFGIPHLVSASHIVVHNYELKTKAGNISYASGTYRLFKLPRNTITSKAKVMYKGTIAGLPDKFVFDSSHCFKNDSEVEVDGEMAAILLSSRFTLNFDIQILNQPEQSCHSRQQDCHLSPFLLADMLGSSVKQCSKISQSKHCNAGTN